MKISEIMTKEVITVKEDDFITDVAEIMTRERIHAVPVVNSAGDIIGIVTESDFFSRQSPALVYFPTVIDYVKSGKLHEFSEVEEVRESVKVALTKDIMVRNCVTVNEGSDINEFLEIVKERGFISVPVVNDGGKLTGIIAVADVLKFLKASQ